MIDLNISVKKINNLFTLLELEGEMDICTSIEFKKTLNELIEKKKVRLIVDLEKVTYIDSVGVGSLLGALKKTRDRKGDLWLIYSRKSGVWKFFDITNLDNNFSIYKTQNEAFKILNLKEENQLSIDFQAAHSV